jgi:hypothetical protein
MAFSPVGDSRAVAGIGGLGYELRKRSSRVDFSYRLDVYRSPHPSPKKHPPPQNAPPTNAQLVHPPSSNIRHPPTSTLPEHSPTTAIHSPHRPAHTRTTRGRLPSRRRRLACETRQRPNRATNAGQEATRPRGQSQGGSPIGLFRLSIPSGAAPFAQGSGEAGSCRVARERTAINPNNRRLDSPVASPLRPGANHGIHLTGSTVAGYGVEWAVVGGVLWKASSR